MNENDAFKLSLIGERHANSMLISMAMAMAIKEGENKQELLRYALAQLKKDWPSGLPEKYPDLPKHFIDVIARSFASQIDAVLQMTEVTTKAMDEAGDAALH